MYPTRKLGCFSTLPFCGTISPVRILTRVDFPAPLAPIIATRDEREREQVISYNEGLGLLGYVYVTPVILMIERVLDFTPVRRPGGGKKNLTEEASSV